MKYILENRKIDPQKIAVLSVDASAGGVGGIKLPGYEKSLLFSPVNQGKQILRRGDDGVTGTAGAHAQKRMRGPGSIRRDRVIHIFLQVLEEHKLRVLVFHVQGRRFLPAPGELTEGIHHVKSGILARIGKPLLDALRDIRVGHNNIGSREILQGDLPSPANPPSGCIFHTRCFMAQDICSTQSP